MDKFFLIVGGSMVAASWLLVLPLVGFLLGAFSGMVVGTVFNETFATFIVWLGVDLQPWQVGGLLGFVGVFFRSVQRKGTAS